MGFRWSQPDNEVAFELLCKRFLRHQWRCPYVERLGKRGERQFGIDLIDSSGGRPLRAAQCKHHEMHKTLPFAEVEAEVEEAKKYLHKLDEFYILTTARKTEDLQTKLITLNQKHQAAGLFIVFVRTWQDIEEDLSEIGEDIRDHILHGDTGRGLGDLCRMIARSASDSATRTVADNATREFELDNVKEQLENHEYVLARTTLDRIETRHWGELSARQRFRTLALKANTYLATGDFEKAGFLLQRAAPFQPDDENAEVKGAIAYELLGDRAKAQQQAVALLSKYPHSSHLHALNIRSAPPDAKLEDLIASIPSHLQEDSEIAAAVASVAVQRRDAIVAEAYARKATSVAAMWPPGWMVFGQALHLAGWGAGTVADREAKLKEANTAYTRAITLAKEQNTPHIQFASLLNRGIVRELLDTPGYEEDFKAAAKLDPQDIDAVRMYAFSLGEHGKLDEAVTSARQFYESAKTPEAGVLLSTFFYDRNAEGDREEAAKICEHLIRSAPGRVTDALEILVHVRSQQGRGKEVLDLLSSFTEAQLPLVARQTCHAHILLAQEDREAALCKAKDSIGLLDGQTPILDRWRLARLLARLGAHFEAVDVFLGFVQKGRLDIVTQQLLDSAQLAGRHDVVLRILREARQAGVTDDRALRNEVALLQRYNPEEAVRILQATLDKNPENREARLWLALLGARLHRPEFNCADPDKLPPTDDADPATIGRWVVQVLAHAGNTEAALRVAYQLLRKHYDNADAHRTYLFLFLGGPLVGDQPKLKLETPAVVCTGSALGYKETGETEVCWVIVEDTPPIPGRIGEIALDDPLAIAMLGRAVGETVTLAEGSVQPRLAVIKEIQNKYVHCFQKVLHDFQLKFPTEPDLQMVRGTVDETGNAIPDLPAMKRSLEQRKTYVNQILDLYKAHTVPLHLLSEYASRDLFSLLTDLAGMQSFPIKCCTGSLEERGQAFDVIREKLVPVVDAIALFTLALLSRLELLSNWPQKPIVSRGTYDLILTLQEQARQNPERAYLTLDAAGNLCGADVSQEAQQAHADRLDALRQAMEQHCIVTLCPQLAELDPTRREQFLEVFGQHGVESLLLASEPSRMLWTDDQVLGVIGEKEFGVKRVWTQVLLHSAAESGRIDWETFNSTSNTLRAAGYVFTWWTPHVLISVANRVEWNPSAYLLRVLLEDLGSENVQEEGRFLLAAAAIHSSYATTITSHVRYRFIFAVLDQLARLDDPNVCAEILARVLRRMSAETPDVYRDARSLLTMWAEDRQSEIARSTCYVDIYIVPPTVDG